MIFAVTSVTPQDSKTDGLGLAIKNRSKDREQASSWVMSKQTGYHVTALHEAPRHKLPHGSHMTQKLLQFLVYFYLRTRSFILGK